MILIRKNLFDGALACGNLACKKNASVDKNVEENATSPNSNSALSQHNDTQEASNGFVVHDFGEGEKILVVPKQYSNVLAPNQTQAETSTNTETTPPDADAQTPKEPISTTIPQDTLSQDAILGATLGTSFVAIVGAMILVPTRKMIRGAESVRALGFRIKGGSNYAENYFTKKVKEARSPNSKLTKYNEIPALRPNGVDVGSRVFLGAIPEASTLKEIADKLQGPNNSITVISMLEDFELNFMRKNIANKALPDLDKKPLSSDRISFQREVPLVANLPIEVKQWKQFVTPDRTMMSISTLNGAIDAMLGATRNGSSVFVHCKSGKGRSASVVVGARVAERIDDAIKSQIKLSDKEINKMISEEIKNVKKYRNEISISKPQEFNLRETLQARYAEAKKLRP